MSDVQGRLHILLDYWIEHNREHEQEFREWADKIELIKNPLAHH